MSNNQDTESDLIQVNHDELEEIIKWCEESQLPLMISGTFGIGKSTVVQEVAKEFSERDDNREFVHFNEASKEDIKEMLENPEDYYVYFDIRLAENRPEDMKGIPDLDSEIDATDWNIPIWGKLASLDDIAGTIFLDEVNLANPSVQAAFYKLILDRQIGDETLSDDMFVLAAGNRAGKDRANVNAMSAPLRNRFTHVELTTPSGGKDGDWTKWAIENGIHEYIVDFIGSPAGANWLYKFEEGSKDHKVIPTPRTWEYLSDLLYAIEEKKGEVKPEDIRKAGSMTIGEPAGNFASYIEIREEYNPQKYMDNPSKITELNTESSDIQVSVITGMASIYRDDTDKLEKILEAAIHLKKEMGSLLLSHAQRYHPKQFKRGLFDEDVVDQEISNKVADRYKKILQDD